MKILFHRKFQKFIQKIKEKTLIKKVKFEIDFLIENPQKAKVLEHPFRKYKNFSHKFLYKKNSYRIAYTTNTKEMIFLVIDTRENFYEKLKRVI